MCARFFGLGLLSLFVLGLLPGQPLLSHAQAQDKTTKLTCYGILQLLNEEMDIDAAQIPRELQPFLIWLQKTIETKHNVALRIQVNVAAFKAENVDPPNVLDTTVVKMPPLVPRMTYAEILTTALAQVPTKNATYLIRKGKLEITTEEAASPKHLLASKVVATFFKKPCRDALEDLSEQSGMSIVIDPRVNEKTNTPITATFANNATLESAVTILTNMVGVEAILLRDVLYITTPENAQKLRTTQDQLGETPSKNLSLPKAGA